MAEEGDLQYKTEYAKSNRSSCKACKGVISKETLRMARMVQAPNFDGKIPHWYHFNCFFKKFLPPSTGDVGGFHSLRWDDQKRIEGVLAGGSGTSGGGGGAKQKGAEKGKSKGAVAQPPAPKLEKRDDLVVEYAKSGRSKCRKCYNLIDQGVVRVAKMVEPDPDDVYYDRYYSSQPHPVWYHLDCFKANLSQLDALDVVADHIPGFKALKKLDQKLLIEALGESGLTTAAGKKRGAGGSDEVDAPLPAAKKSKEEKKEEKQLKDQNELLWSVRDMLRRELNNNQLKEMLQFNGQAVPSGESNLLDRCCDGMLFGALVKCITCGGGQLVCSSASGAYICTGNVSGWTKCSFSTKTPDKVPWKIPQELKDASEELKKFKLQSRTRAFPELTAVASKKAKAAEETDGPKDDEDLPQTIPQKQASVDRSKEPLGGLTVVIVGRLSKSQAALSKDVASQGGTVVTKISPKVDLCISKKEETTKGSAKMKELQAENIPVVDEGLVTSWKPGGSPPSISDSLVSDWGKEKFKDKYEPPPKRKPSSQPAPVKKQKMMVKGGGVVDLDSGLERSHHVYQQKGRTYNAVLGMVDIKRGTNSYYKMQVLEADKVQSYCLFRSWGRVGTTIGGNKTERFMSAAATVAEFEQLYEEKTGNQFEQGSEFVKYPNKFYPLELDYGQDDEDLTSMMAEAGAKSTLSSPVQELVRMIFDVETMKAAMMEFEIDMQKMPLGKLSKKQIQSAYAVLTEALGELEGDKDPVRLLDCSNRFFTLIPHDFGMKKPPLLDNPDIIKEKTGMLDSLLDIEIAYSLLRESVSSGEKDPLDVHYEILKATIEPLDKDSDEYKLLEEYVHNTHGATHTSYKLEVDCIFKMVREGEENRFKPFRKLHNHRLLWHGSRTTNYAGIISQGLRIAPPEAPSTGYMFGKGVYFADMVTKSANYCWVNRSNPVGLMLLCDVALGDMYELQGAKFVTKLPAGKHSTKGCGRTHPDPAEDVVTSEGVLVPKGKGIPSSVTHTSLLYNEYIVYDVAQINMRYLFKMKFQYSQQGLWF